MREVPKRKYSFNCVLHPSKLHCGDRSVLWVCVFNCALPVFLFWGCKSANNKRWELKRGMKWCQNFGCHMFVSGSFAVVIAACVINFHRALGLLVIALLTVFFLVWDWIMERYGDRMWEAANPVRQFLSRNWFWMKWWEIWSLHIPTEWSLK